MSPSTTRPNSDAPSRPEGEASRSPTEGSSTAQPPRKERRRTRPLRWIASLVGLVLTLVLILLVFVLGTQTGLRTLIAIAEDIAPGVIAVERVDGRLLGNLALEGFVLTLPGLDVSVGSLALDWTPTALLTGTLRVQRLTGSDIDVLTAPSTEEKPPAEPFELPSIRFPIGVDIDQVLVERFSYNQIGAPAESAIRLTRAELSATANGDTVDLRRLMAELSQPDARARAAGSVQLDASYPIELTLDWRFRQAPALSVDGEGRIDGDLSDLRITHRISGSVDATLQAQVKDVLKTLSWQGQIDLNAVDLPQLVADAPDLNLEARIQTAGDLDKASVTGTLRGDAPALSDMGRLAADLDLEWSAKVLTIKALRLSELVASNAARDADARVADDDRPASTPLGAAVNVTGRLDTNPSVPAFSIEAVWERLRWPLTGAAVAESPQGSLDVHGTLDAYDYRLSAKALGQQIPVTGLALVGTGDQRHAEIAELTIETLSGLVDGKGRASWTPAVTWDFALTAAGIDPGLQWDGLDGEIGLKADTRGGLEDGFSYNLRLDAKLAAYPAAIVSLNGTGTDAKADIDQLSVETLGGVIEATGNAAWSPTPIWTLALQARDIDPGRHYEGLDGRIGLTARTSGGLASGFDFDVQGDAAIASYPPARIDLNGTGTETSARIEALAIDVIGGRIDGTGDLTWSPALRWDAGLTLANLDPGKVLADWPGSLGGRIESKGATAADGLDLVARITDFGGRLRGYPVRVQAEMSMAGQVISVESLEASSGDTRLSASGRADEMLDFRYAFRSPNLSALLPELEGKLDAEGAVSGTVEAPRVTLKLTGRDIEMSGQGIAQISADADVGLGIESPLRVDLSGSDLLVGTQRFETLSVRGEGAMKAHRLSADIKGDALSLSLAAQGGLDASGAYRGSLERLDLSTQDYDDWRLQKAAPFSLAGSTISAGPLCIGNGASSGGCVGFEQPEAGRFSATLDLERLGFDLADAFIPDTMALAGYVTANARFQGQGDLLTGTARVEVPDGSVEILLSQASDTLVFSGTRLDVRADTSGINATFALPVRDSGRVDAEVGLPGFRLTSTETQRLNGRVRIGIDGLDRFASLSPSVSDLNGAINGDITLAGTLAKPDIRGNLAVRDLALKVPSIGLEVADLNLEAQSLRADSVRVDGGASIGGGQLTVAGEAAGIGSAQPNARITLKGRQLKVADTKEYFAIISLDMNAGLGAGGAAVQGEISIPNARIKPRTLPAGAIQPSPDVVLEEKTEEGGLPISVDVLAKLGDQVLLEAFGLRGLLRGQLRVTQQPGKQLLGDGELQVIDGTYRVSLPGLGILASVGKPLVIKKGIVVFAKTPLDNPGIILNAQREGGDITAGVRVLGTLRNPKLAFFSESDPNLSQSEITSYLVTGVPPKRGGKTDDRSLSVGTYIAPKIFMEYDSSLGDKSDSVKMRYDVTKRIQVQSETGDAQGVDIFYKFEN